MATGSTSAVGCAGLSGLEFEQRYQVSYEGSARLFGLGIADGSNGYWDAATLKVSCMPDRALRLHWCCSTSSIAALHGAPAPRQKCMAITAEQCSLQCKHRMD